MENMVLAYRSVAKLITESGDIIAEFLETPSVEHSEAVIPPAMPLLSCKSHLMLELQMNIEAEPLGDPILGRITLRPNCERVPPSWMKDCVG